jgi:membrane-bound metal-dependent hydrolase YbcI (DUF457 family)
MDVGTHALASFALVRIALPRAPRRAWLAVIAAGTVADLDALSAFASPSAYLSWHRTYTHSILASIVVGALLSVAFFRFVPKAVRVRVTPFALVATILLAEWLHLAMDACQSQGVMVLWPFSAHRFAADWLAQFDPWIIAALLLAILLPELLRLVSNEIGAKDKQPRGRTGAIIGLALVVFYIGLRASFHANVLSAAEARTYRGQSARRVAAFPEVASIFTWHGIVETDNVLYELTIDATPGASFDPDSGVALYKPAPSAALDKARDSQAAKRFLAAARFPKATVEKTVTGYEVQLRDLRYAASGETRREIAAVVGTDSNGNVTSDELVWAGELRRR